MTIQGAIIIQEIVDGKVFQIILPAGAQWSEAAKFADMGFKQVLAMAQKADEQNKEKLEEMSKESDTGE